MAPDTAGRLRSPSKPLCVTGEGHVQLLVEKLWTGQKCPCPGVPPGRPLWRLRSCCPPPTPSAGQWGSGRLAGVRQTWLQILTGPWPFAKALTTLSSFTHSEDHASPLLVGLRPNHAALSTLTAGARKCRLPLLPSPPGVSR